MGDTKLLNITNLITAGADPNGYDEYHMTPLHWAVIKGQRLAVELLLQRGAHTDVRDSSDRTPMHFVAIYGALLTRLMCGATVKMRMPICLRTSVRPQSCISGVSPRCGTLLTG